MMTDTLRWIATKPLLRWLIWLLFAAFFYKSGESFTVWLSEPEQVRDAVQWLWIVLFLALLPAFFIVNRHVGCASGSCAAERGRIGAGRPPGH